MPESVSISNPTDLALGIKSALAEIRHLLLHAPTSLSISTTGPVLERISLDMLSLSQAVSPPPREVLLEIQALSASVQALYRGAAGFFGGLSAESIKNGAWDAASYSADGEWSVPRPPRIRVEG